MTNSNAKYAIYFFLSSIAFYICVIGIYFAFIVFDPQKIQIDIPYKILRDFSIDNDIISSINYIEIISQTLPPIIWLAAMISMAKGLLTLSTDYMRRQIPVLSMLIMLGIVTDMIPSVLSSGDDLLSSINRHDYSRIVEILNDRGYANTPESSYLLAQISIAEGKNHLVITDDLIERIVTPSSEFSPDPEILSYIKSSMAGASMVEDKSANSEHAKLIIGILSLFSAIPFIIGTLLVLHERS